MTTNVDPFASFDPSQYHTVPNIPLQTMASLTKALIAAAPDDPPTAVELLTERLEDSVSEAEAAMVVRLREDNEGAASTDLALDNAIDPLWSLLRARLGAWAVYEREGLDFLEDDDDAPPVIDLEDLHDKARRARHISDRLFGADGLAFVQRPYSEQAQLMANVLALIDTDDLADDIVELTGEELLPILRRCQVRYEATVQARAMRDSGSAADLRVLRNRLRRLIQRYAGAVMAMLDEDDPETLTVVETALKPLRTMRPVLRPQSESESEFATEVVDAVANEDSDAAE